MRQVVDARKAAFSIISKQPRLDPHSDLSKDLLMTIAVADLVDYAEKKITGDKEVGNRFQSVFGPQDDFCEWTKTIAELGEKGIDQLAKNLGSVDPKGATFGKGGDGAARKFVNDVTEGLHQEQKSLLFGLHSSISEKPKSGITHVEALSAHDKKAMQTLSANPIQGEWPEIFKRSGLIMDAGSRADFSPVKIYESLQRFTKKEWDVLKVAASEGLLSDFDRDDPDSMSLLAEFSGLDDGDSAHHILGRAISVLRGEHRVNTVDPKLEKEIMERKRLVRREIIAARKRTDEELRKRFLGNGQKINGGLIRKEHLQTLQNFGIIDQRLVDDPSLLISTLSLEERVEMFNNLSSEAGVFQVQKILIKSAKVNLPKNDLKFVKVAMVQINENAGNILGQWIFKDNMPKLHGMEDLDPVLSDIVRRVRFPLKGEPNPVSQEDTANFLNKEVESSGLEKPKFLGKNTKFTPKHVKEIEDALLTTMIANLILPQPPKKTD
ncbi:MAG: hypothetical protein ABH950_00785 [Candidatus Altiarchaeota archaeon]